MRYGKPKWLVPSLHINKQGLILHWHMLSIMSEAAYNRAEYVQQRRVMMCWWSEHIENAAIGNMSGVSGLLVSESCFLK